MVKKLKNRSINQFNSICILSWKKTCILFLLNKWRKQNKNNKAEKTTVKERRKRGSSHSVLFRSSEKY